MIPEKQSRMLQWLTIFCISVRDMFYRYTDKSRHSIKLGFLIYFLLISNTIPSDISPVFCVHTEEALPSFKCVLEISGSEITFIYHLLLNWTLIIDATLVFLQNKRHIVRTQLLYCAFQ